MIIQDDFIVTGRTRIFDDILVCRKKLIFKKDESLESKLVIAPKNGMVDGAQRMLKIIADTIDTGQDGDSEITYDLDGDFKLDPETKAIGGEPGNPDFKTEMLSTSVAAPNYTPNDPYLDWVGSYPRANNGGNGIPGGRGGDGNDGQNAPILEIWVNIIVGKGLNVVLKGQDGGDGGKGGTGQDGGNGQKGSRAIVEAESHPFGPGTMSVCKQNPGMGGDGGRGGDAGCGGDGGNGGTGGVVKIFHTKNADVQKLKFAYQGGEPGMPGEPGNPGVGGILGPRGDDEFRICWHPPYAWCGEFGRTCDKKAREGNRGADGFDKKTLIDRIPVFP